MANMATRGPDVFAAYAPRLIADLMQEFGVSRETAAAAVGNLAHESDRFRAQQEYAYPNDRGALGRGGDTSRLGTPDERAEDVPGEAVSYGDVTGTRKALSALTKAESILGRQLYIQRGASTNLGGKHKYEGGFSDHDKGGGFDFDISKMNDAQKLETVSALKQVGFYSFGFGRNSLHAGMVGAPRAWTYSAVSGTPSKRGRTSYVSIDKGTENIKWAGVNLGDLKADVIARPGVALADSFKVRAVANAAPADNIATSPWSVPGQPASGVEAYIRQAAIARGINPDVAVRVAKSEGGLSDPLQQSNVVKNGVRETSYGPFQLRIGGGLGDLALRAGIDPRKDTDWQKGVDFALNHAAQHGWGDWSGAGKAGLSNFAGITKASQPVAVGAGLAPVQTADLGTPIIPGYTAVGDPGDLGVIAASMPAATPVSAAPSEPSHGAWNKVVSDVVFGGDRTGRSIASTPPGRAISAAEGYGARDASYTLPSFDIGPTVQRGVRTESSPPVEMMSPAEKPSTYTPTWTPTDTLTPTKDPLQAVNEGQAGGLIKAAQRNMATVVPVAVGRETPSISPIDYAFGRPDTVDISPDLSIPAAAPMLAKDEPVKAPSMAAQGPPQTFDMSPTREPTRLNKLFGAPGMQSYSGVSPIAQSVIAAAHAAGLGVSPGTPAGYHAPNFSSGSGGAVFAYKPNVDANGNPTGTGTYINSYGQTMTY